MSCGNGHRPGSPARAITPAPPRGSFTIAKANPNVEVPNNLTATYGDTLANVALPDGWSWDDPGTTPVGNVGNNTFSATYTPEDTGNYNMLQQSLTISVRSSGSSGGSSITTETTKNPDGSTTITVTNKVTGTVTETTKFPDGLQGGGGDHQGRHRDDDHH